MVPGEIAKHIFYHMGGKVYVDVYLYTYEDTSIHPYTPTLNASKAGTKVNNIKTLSLGKESKLWNK